MTGRYFIYPTAVGITLIGGMNPVLAEFTNPGSYIGLQGFNKFGPRLKPVEDLAASGNKWVRARVISKTIDKGTPSVEPLPNNVGWGSRQLTTPANHSLLLDMSEVAPRLLSEALSNEELAKLLPDYAHPNRNK